MEEQKIIIIGGGIAGLSAAQAARETAPHARIHLICGEKRLPYYRSRICELFSGQDESKLLLRNTRWFMDADIHVVYAYVTSINPEIRQVRFSDGSFLYYDKLILATGAKGNLPAIPGSDLPNAIPLRSIADIQAVQSYPGPAVIVGDGLLGLEAAWHLCRAGRSVVVVGHGPRLLSRQLDEEAGIALLYIAERAGIRIAQNGEVEAFEDDLVTLADGRGFSASVLLFAAGIKSDVRLGNKAGVLCQRGIVVDDHMHTIMPDIFAAGDCAEYNDEIYGQWTMAMAQGAVAGVNAAGGEKVFVPDTRAYLLNAFGVQIWSCGNIHAADSAVRRDNRSVNFRKLFFAEDALVGVELIGDTKDMPALKKAVEQSIPKKDALSRFLPEQE